ncbi:hypothetical protein E4L96_09920 [Massilia arenosa]|uniref:Uncharacterized protein n=1 Tax=Zemynaea arenosa TaxID=2561931 RepID=A0A4Y9SGR8_9BURK|nr:hypothetical protein [Massilia arenosa]TFW20808.1 hypothetical protein E4L96_09920 [Massilia arenosa]
MTRIALEAAADALAGLNALRSAMTDDLEDVESYLDQADAPRDPAAEADLAVYHVMRASLYSGLACINEVLGWVKLLADSAPEGEFSETLKALPPVPVFSIH